MGFSKRCAVLGALVFISCGSPAELDDETFPSLGETGYAQTTAGAGGSTQTAVPGGGAAGSSSPVAGAGSTGQPPGGAGAPPGGAGSGGMVGGACPSDITQLFGRPAAQGGCTSGGGCHEAGGASSPDLVSPGVASRLLNVQSRCFTLPNGMSVAARPYISATDSFLEEKLTGPVAPNCGFTMPLLMEYALSETDRQCIINWIDQVAAGGG